MKKCTCGRKEFSFLISAGVVVKSCPCGKKETREISEVLAEGRENVDIQARRHRYNVKTFMRVEPGTPCWDYTVGRNEKLRMLAASNQALLYLQGSAFTNYEHEGHYRVGWMIAPSGEAIEASC